MKVNFQQEDFNAKFNNDTALDADLETVQQMDVGFRNESDFAVNINAGEDFICVMGGEITTSDYSGSYSVTPSNERQSLPTADKTLARNIVVEPIPSNYGLITWNGSTITVS